MLRTFLNAWKVADLRKKILYTALILFLFRLGSWIPVPFLDPGIMAQGGIVAATDETFMSYLSMLTGGAFSYGTIFAMSITPFINSSIIMQLLTVALPPLERLAKEGETGRKKIASITRYLTIGLAALQSTGYYFYLRNGDYLLTDAAGSAFSGGWAFFQALVIILVLTAGSALIMWMGEQINEKGIGNGISLILFVGIIARIPAIATQLYDYWRRGGAYYALVPITIVLLLGIVAFIVFMDKSERRIPVQYAKRVVGRKMYGGQSTHIPIKVNMSGVMPIIFASSILSLPATIGMFIDYEEGSGWDTFFSLFSQQSPFYGCVYFLLIIFFAYFYATIQYNPIEMANNIRKNSGAIPGIRPGKPTSDYIAKILSKITLMGALMLSVVALFPIVFSQLTALIMDNEGMTIAMGGTSVIILVGVALETVKQLESQLMMRHYKGFLDN